MTNRIISREEWGAKPASLPTAWMVLPAKEVWTHHTVTEPSADPKKDMRAVESTGLQRFGVFSYSYCVHPNGAVLEGAGLRRGAHTARRNSTAFGLSFIGNYENRDPTAEQMESARWLIWTLQEQGHLRPGTYPTGGHRDLMATACPGSRLYRRLDDLRVPWFPPEAVQQAPTVGVFDFEESSMKAMRIHIGPLDKDGNGWSDWQPGLGRDPSWFSVALWGPSPGDDGYWPHQRDVNLSAQPRGGSLRITVRNGTPGDTVMVMAAVA